MLCVKTAQPIATMVVKSLIMIFGLMMPEKKTFLFGNKRWTKCRDTTGSVVKGDCSYRENQLEAMS